MSNEIDLIVGKKVLAELDLMNAKLLQGHDLILKMSQMSIDTNKGTSKITTPAGLTTQINDNAKLTAELTKQAQVNTVLDTQIKKLNTTISTKAKLTAQEIADGRILRTEQNQQAVLTSKLAGAYKKLSTEQAISATNVQNIIARGRTATQTQKQYNQELERAQRDFDGLNKKVLLADRAVGRFNRNVGNYPKQAILGMKDLLGAFGIVGGVAAIAGITRNIYENVKAQQSLDLALKQVTGTQDAYARAQMFVKEQAELNGAEINSLQGAYTKFFVSASDKLAAKDIENIFGSITKAGSALGLSIDNQDKAFLALSQMMSKGTVQAEELRGQLGDALPGAVGIATRAYQKLHPELKVTEASFAKLMKDGKILAAELLPEMARELERTYNLDTIGRVENLATAQNRLTNYWKEFIRELNDGNGTVSKTFSQITVGMGRMLQGLTNYIKSDEERRTEELSEIRTNAYTQELDALQALGSESKKQAELRKAETQPLLDNAKLEKKALLEKIQTIRDTNHLTSTGKIINYEARAEYGRLLKILKSVNADSYTYAGIIAATNEVLKKKNNTQGNTNELTKEEIALLKKAEQERKRALEELLRNQHSLSLSNLEREKKLINDRFENEAEYATERIRLSDEIANKDSQINTAIFLENIRLHKDSLELRKIDANNYRTSQEKSEKESEERIYKIKEDNFNAFVEYQKKYGKAVDEDKFGTGTTALPTEDMQKLVNDWKDKKKKDDEDELARIEKLKQATNDYFKEIQANFLDESGLGSLNFFMELDENGKSTFDKLIEGAEGMGEKMAVAFEGISEVAQEVFNIIAQQSEARFQAEISRLESQKDIAIQYAGESTTAKAEIERQYEERRKQLERKKAEESKKVAIFNAVIDTAQAVVGALAEQNYAGAILFGIIGAAQIAMIQSQPIPAFAMGGTHEGGMMLVNDGKGSNYGETIVAPDGKIAQPTGRNVLMNAPKGTEIYTADQWQNQLNNLLLSNGILPMGTKLPSEINKPNGITMQQMESIMKRYAKTQSDTVAVNIDENGFMKRVTSGGQTREILNSRLRTKLRNI